MKGERSKRKNGCGRSDRRIVIVTLLAAAVFMVGSLDVPLRPEQGSTFVVFFALTTLLAAALPGVYGDLRAQPGAAVDGAAQRADGLAVQGEDGDGSDGRIAAAHGGVFFFQLRAGEPHVESWFPGRWKSPTSRASACCRDLGRANMDHLNAIAAKAAASSKEDQSLLGLAWSVDASVDLRIPSGVRG